MNDASWVPGEETVSGNNRFVVLQYNTHLFEGSLALLGAAAKAAKEEVWRFVTGDRNEPMDPLLFADEERRSHIARLIQESDADLVALNEVWSDANMGWFADKLQDVYPYHAFGPRSSGVLLGSGLVLLSKYKIDAIQSFIYDRDRQPISIAGIAGTEIEMPHDFEEDTWAKKGVLVALITGPGGKKVVISLSHTKGSSDIPHLVEQTGLMETALIKSELSADDSYRCPYCHGTPPYALIVAGDLNVHKSKRGELKAEMERLAARESWTEVHGTQECATIDLPNNKLDQIFSPRKLADPGNEGQVDQLDFVFFRSSSHPNSLPIKPREADVLKDWVFDWKHGYHQDLMRARWMSNYVAVRSFELNGHPYLFGLKQSNNRAYISRIRDDGHGWEDLGSWKWQSNYIAVVSYQLKGHPYLFGLKSTGEAFISRINDDGHGWVDVEKTQWSRDYIGSCITPFYISGEPYLFALKGNDEGWITKLTEPGVEEIDLSDHYPMRVVFNW
jgi:hypothetical protein